MTRIPVDPNAGTRGQLQPVIGTAAAGATDDASEPVKVGGINSTTPPTLTDGQRGNIQLDTKGNIRVALVGGNGTTTATGGSPNGDGASTAVGALYGLSLGLLFNGTTWDRARANQDNITAGITASGVTTTQTGADQTNYNARGVKVVLNTTVIGTGSVTLEIDGKDPVSGTYYAILTGAAVVTNVTNVYTVYPGATAAANVSVSDALPRTWRVKVTANNANAATYTVGASLIL